MRYTFEFYDPIDGEAPEYLTGVFKNLIIRANQHLIGKSRDQIEQILEALNSILDGPAKSASFDVIREVIKNKKSENVIDNIPGRTTSAYKLWFARDNYELDISPKTTWAEIFAVLSLAELNRTMYSINFHRNRPKFHDCEEDRYEIAGYGIDEMVSAISFADLLKIEENTRNNLLKADKEKISLKNTMAVMNKHHRTNALLYDIKGLWETGNFKKYADCIEHFLAITPEHKYQHIKKSNINRTLTQGLSAVLKNKRKSFKEYETLIKTL